MDIALVISLIVLAVIAVIEIICLFFCSKLRTDILPITAVIPVTAEDTKLTERLDFLEELITRSTRPFDIAVLVNYGASPEQSAVCISFCAAHTQVSFVSPTELEVILKETFK